MAKPVQKQKNELLCTWRMWRESQRFLDAVVVTGGCTLESVCALDGQNVFMIFHACFVMSHGTIKLHSKRDRPHFMRMNHES